MFNSKSKRPYIRSYSFQLPFIAEVLSTKRIAIPFLGANYLDKSSIGYAFHLFIATLPIDGLCSVPF